MTPTPDDFVNWSAPLWFFPPSLTSLMSLPSLDPRHDP